MKKLLDLLNSERGSMVASMILGLGMATLFRKTCGSGNCILVRAPDVDALRHHIYELDGVCYKYTPRAVTCSRSTQKHAPPLADHIAR